MLCSTFSLRFCWGSTNFFLEHIASHHQRLYLEHLGFLDFLQEGHQAYLHLQDHDEVQVLCQVLELHGESVVKVVLCLGF